MAQLVNKNKANTVASLENTSFGNYVSSYSWQGALAAGSIVDVTAWICPSMGFGKEDFRVAVAVTSRLWNVIIQGCLRLQEGSRGCGSRDFLWLAAAALERARREEKDAANFVAVFPWYEEEDEDQDELARSQLRVEYSVSAEGKSVVTIGFPDEFAVL